MFGLVKDLIISNNYSRTGTSTLRLKKDEPIILGQGIKVMSDNYMYFETEEVISVTANCSIGIAFRLTRTSLWCTYWSLMTDYYPLPTSTYVLVLL